MAPRPQPRLLVRASMMLVLSSTMAHALLHHHGGIGNAVAPEHLAPSRSAPYRQRLTNFNDVLYLADMVVGGQTIKGVIDTSSSDLLVFTKRCRSCGGTQAYDTNLSRTLVEGRHRRMQAYGSGTCTTVNATEAIRIGPHAESHQAFMEAKSCQMPLLSNAPLNAIIGAGPPDEPVHSAMQELKQIQNQIKAADRSKQEHVAHELMSMERKLESNLQDLRKTRSLLENLNVSSFSVCLERGRGAPGWFVWNDTGLANASRDAQLKVVGADTWGVRMKNMHLQGGHKNTSVKIGCWQGCNAILDTGTSLLGVPHNVYQKVRSAVMDLKSAVNCSDLSNLPDIAMELGSQTIRLPPSSYMGKLVGEEPGAATGMRRLQFGQHETGDTCELLLMDTEERRTKFGPLVILGVPFFREYYTTFNLGSRSKSIKHGGEQGPSISIAPATDDCRPAPEQHAAQAEKEGRPAPAREVDTSLLRIPSPKEKGKPLKYAAELEEA